MTTIYLDVSERTLRIIYSELLGVYEAAEQERDDAKAVLAEKQAAFEEVSNTMSIIKRALLPAVQETTVLSDDGSRLYLVKRFADRAPGEQDTCSCPSFQYQRGLDALGQCKHIRKAIQRGSLV